MKRSIRYLVRNFRYRSCYVVCFYFEPRIVKIIKLRHHKRISDRVIERISIHHSSFCSFNSFVLERRHSDKLVGFSLNIKDTLGYYIDLLENSSFHDNNPNIEILRFYEIQIPSKR